MKLSFKFLLVAIIAIVGTTFWRTDSHAQTIGFAAKCPDGQSLKQVVYGTAVVITCDGGGKADFAPDSNDPARVIGTYNCANTGGNVVNNGNNLVITCNDNTVPSVSIAGSSTPSATFQGDCNGGGVTLGVKLGGSNCAGSGSDNPIYAYLRGIIQFASGLFGLAAVMMIIVSGIQYITSSGNPQAVANAKSRLGHAVIGIILFLLMFSILNYLIPGGVFG